MARKKKEEIKSDYKYQTIASTDRRYSTYEIMKEYNTLAEAKANYNNDMKEWKLEHEDYHSFGIKEVPK